MNINNKHKPNCPSKIEELKLSKQIKVMHLDDVKSADRT